MYIDDPIDDEYAVPENADRGDVIEDEKAAKEEPKVEDTPKEPAEEAPDKEDEELARGPDGKFVKKTEEEEAPAEDDIDDKQNFPIRLNKLKQQRDNERAAREAAEAELRELKAGKRAEPEDDVVDPIDEINASLEAMYEQVEEARADGDTKLAAKLQRDIDAKNREISRLESERVAGKVTSETRINVQYDTMIESLERGIPALDPAHEEYQPELVQELEFQVNAYEKAGLSATAALRRAVTLLFRVDPWAPRSAAKVEAPAPPAKKPEDKKPDIKKAIETSKKQPPDAADRGVNVEDKKIDPRKLSDEDFDKLPEATKRRLRGDET